MLKRRGRSLAAETTVKIALVRNFDLSVKGPIERLILEGLKQDIQSRITIVENKAFCCLEVAPHDSPLLLAKINLVQ